MGSVIIPCMAPVPRLIAGRQPICGLLFGLEVVHYLGEAFAGALA